jgi:hypothetical protein
MTRTLLGEGKACSANGQAGARLTRRDVDVRRLFTHGCTTSETPTLPTYCT